MVRNSLKYASTKSQIAKELRQVYTAATSDAADARFAEFEADGGARYPALVAVWRCSWECFVTFLRFPPESRKIVCTTNMIESLNSRFRQATRRRGHSPVRGRGVEGPLPRHPGPAAQPAQPHRPDPQLDGSP